MAQRGTYPLGTSFGPLVIDCNGPLRDRPPAPHASYTQRTSSMTPSRSIVVEMKGQRFERHDETKRKCRLSYSAKVTYKIVSPDYHMQDIAPSNYGAVTASVRQRNFQAAIPAGSLVRK